MSRVALLTDQLGSHYLHRGLLSHVRLLIQAGKRGRTTAERAVSYRAIAEDFIDRMPFLPVFRQNEWWFKNNRWYQPVLDQAGQATEFSTIEILPVFLNAGSWHKYHPEQWDLKPIAP